MNTILLHLEVLEYSSKAWINRLSKLAKKQCGEAEPIPKGENENTTE